MVLGLTGLVRDDPSSYVQESLLTPYIIFQPVELLFSEFKDERQKNAAYGPDLICAKLRYEKILRDIVHKGVKPVFISGGLPDDDDTKLRTIAGRMFSKEKKFTKSSVDMPAASFVVDNDCCIFAKETCRDCIQSMGLINTQTCYSATKSSVGVAYLIDCPFATMSSDCLLFSKPSILPDELKSIKLNDLKVIFSYDSGLLKSTESGLLEVGLFNHKTSPLKDVPACSRPLVGLLMNSQIVRNLPDSIEVTPSESESVPTRKLRSVIDFVAKTNPIIVLKTIMESSSDAKAAEILSRNILSYLAKLCPDFEEATQILHFLNMGQSLPTTTKAPTENVNGVHQSRCSMSPKLFYETAANLIKGGSSDFERPMDFLYRWPKALVHLYRSAMLERHYITALYRRNGVFVNLSNDYLAEWPSTYASARILRYAAYCLLVGLEQSRGQGWKLIGLSPHVKELCYVGNFRFKTFHVHVGPMHLPDSNCFPEDFIFGFLGFQRPSKGLPDWSIALVISCLLWHQQRADHARCGIAECPLVLAALVLAVATHHTMESDLALLPDHYDHLKVLALEKVREQKPPGLQPSAEKALMHCAKELMTIYAHYITLTRFLAALRDGNRKPDLTSPEYNRYPPICLVFPSFSLLVYIAAHLQTTSEPSVQAQRFWLMKAFPTGNVNSESMTRLNKAMGEFSAIREIISTTRLQYTPPQVDVTDPPSYMIPKDERKPRSQAPRRTGVSAGPEGGKLMRQRNMPATTQPRWQNRQQQQGGRRQNGNNYAERLSHRMKDLHLGTPPSQ